MKRSVYGSYELFLQLFNDRGFRMEKTKFNRDIKEILDSFLLEFPEVTAGKMFGYPAYYVRQKLFACIYENGVGIKVPEYLAEELIKSEGVTNFQPMGRAKMKQWIQINRQKPDDYLKDKELFKASVDYVLKSAR
jgi:TfoX/Sxy family transcriptional regulator of competence genes